MEGEVREKIEEGEKNWTGKITEGIDIKKKEE